MKICVVGTGYVGLVVASCLAENGNNVIGVDIDEDKITRLSKGETPIYEPGLGELLKRNLQEERLSFTTNLPEAVKASEFVFIAVGTPPDQDGSADMSQVLSVAESIGRAMNEYKVVVLKSTVPVGTHEKVRDTIAGLTSQRFGVASNPEFLKEGAAIEDFMRPDRVVVGTDDAQVGQLMAELYRPFVRTGNPILVMDPASAEISKYAANAMLASRISFMNEIARFCETVGADVSQVRKAIGADSRIGHAFLFPGVGYGGSCFPKDIRALLYAAEEKGVDLAIVRATEKVNEAQKRFLLPKILELFGGELKSVTLAVWGLAFKPRTDDMREAPSIALIAELAKRGAHLRVFDPEAMKKAKKALSEWDESITYCRKSYDACEGAEGLILVTEWNEFREPDFERLRSMMKRPVVFDGRNIYNPDVLSKLGFAYFGVGRRA
jgi:UDPglucose 6-dehydrogenase